MLSEEERPSEQVLNFKLKQPFEINTYEMKFFFNENSLPEFFFSDFICVCGGEKGEGVPHTYHGLRFRS